MPKLDYILNLVEPSQDQTEQEENQPVSPPYPWCHGSPTKAECARRGYCNRDPNCGD